MLKTLTDGVEVRNKSAIGRVILVGPAFFKRDLCSLEFCWKRTLEERQINKVSNNSGKKTHPHSINNDIRMKSIDDILASVIA